MSRDESFPDPIEGGPPEPLPPPFEASGVADAPAIPGESVHFVVLADGTIVVDEDVPEGSLEPLARVIEESLDAPYRAQGFREDGTLWNVGANEVEIVELPAAFVGESLDLSRVGGIRTLEVDGVASDADVAKLDELGDREEGDDFAVHADRLDDTHWVVDVYAL
ncbi:MAG TPA: hypothetical protein VGF23_24785 [Gaiellaceae bacterium]